MGDYVFFNFPKVFKTLKNVIRKKRVGESQGNKLLILIREIQQEPFHSRDHQLCEFYE